MFKTKYSQSFAVTLAVIPAVVQLIIMLVNGNIGEGIAVVEAFRLVRFRSALGSAREICSIFLVMAAGLATGMGYVAQQAENRNIAIFIDCYDDLRKIYTVAVLSVTAMAVCIVLVYVIVVMLSGRVIAPMIKNEQKQKWIDKAMLQTEKLKRLVNSLVSLAKMDEGAGILKKDTFDISDAISDTAQSFADFAGAQGHRLDISVEPGIRYTGDEYAVRQLVSVLVDNAIKYAEPDTDIYFEMKKDKKGVSISTRNTCSGISTEDTKRLFDRFYRPDRSRNNAPAALV